MDRSRIRNGLRRPVAVLLRAILAGVLLVWLFTSVDFGEVRMAIAGGQTGPLAGAVVASIVFTAVVSVRLAWLLQRAGVAVTFVLVWRVNLAAQFYGLFIPGGTVTNFAIRFGKLTKHAPHGETLAGGMILDRVVGFAAIGYVGALAWAVSENIWLIVGSLVLAVGAVVLVPGIASRPPVSRDSARARRLRLFVRGMSWRDTAWLFPLALLAQVPGGVAFVWVAQSVGVALPILTLVWIRSVVLIASAAPVSVSGLGVREGVLLFLLAERGIAEPTALAVGILFFAATIVAPALIGGANELWRMVARSSNFHG